MSIEYPSDEEQEEPDKEDIEGPDDMGKESLLLFWFYLLFAFYSINHLHSLATISRSKSTLTNVQTETARLALTLQNDTFALEKLVEAIQVRN